MSASSPSPSSHSNVTIRKCETLEWSGPQENITMIVQWLLLFVCGGTLLVKYFLFEKPRRPCCVWFADISKQCFGAALGHIYNLVLAAVLVANTTGGDPCAWYFINISLDTFVSIFVQFLLIDAVEQFAKKRRIVSLERSGDYGDPWKWDWWLIQLVAYCLIVTVVKMTVFGFVFLARNQLNDFGLWIWSPLIGYPTLELILVMIVTPGLMNAWQFWVTDTFIMMMAKNTDRYPTWCCCLCKRFGLLKDGGADGGGSRDGSLSLLDDSRYGAVNRNLSRESSFSGSINAEFLATDEI